MTIQEASCFRLHFLTQGGSSTNVLKTTGGPKKQLPVWGVDLQKKIQRPRRGQLFGIQKNLWEKTLGYILLWISSSNCITILDESVLSGVHDIWQREARKPVSEHCFSHTEEWQSNASWSTSTWSNHGKWEIGSKNFWPFPYKLTYHIPPMEKKLIFPNHLAEGTCSPFRLVTLSHWWRKTVKLQDSQPAETPWISDLAAWLFKKELSSQNTGCWRSDPYNGLVQSLFNLFYNWVIFSVLPLKTHRQPELVSLLKCCCSHHPGFTAWSKLRTKNISKSLGS